MKRNIVIVGFGNIGQAIIHLLQKSFADCDIIVIDQHNDGCRNSLAMRRGIVSIHCRVTSVNFEETLRPLLSSGDFLLNFAPAVSSRALLTFAQSRGAFYLDTGIEPWEYDCTLQVADTSNYALREEMLELKRASRCATTAVVAHGANPGFVSVLVKQALLKMMSRVGTQVWPRAAPTCREEWARLAAALDIRVIQVSERDTQEAPIANVGERFVNTWSVSGFVTECRQDAELGWGTHERQLPGGAKLHRYGCRAGIRLNQPGYQTNVKTWSPLHGEFSAYVLTHNEAISLADYLTVGSAEQPIYRPTVYYAYRPMDMAIETMKALVRAPDQDIVGERVLKEEITSGVDELGVLLMSGKHGSLWYGSALSIDRARSIAPDNNATSLQVVSSVVGAMRWMLRNPAAGIVESEEIDHVDLFEYTRHYWEPIQCVATYWRPDPKSWRLEFEEFRLDPDSTGEPSDRGQDMALHTAND